MGACPRPNRVAQCPGPEAVDHRHLLEAGERGVVEVAIERLEGFLDARTTEIERGRNGSRSVEAERPDPDAPRAPRAAFAVRVAGDPRVRADRPVTVHGERREDRIEVVRCDADPHLARLEGGAGPALLEGRDPALPAAAPAPGLLAELPDVGRLGCRKRSLGLTRHRSVRQAGELRLGAGDGCVE